MGVDLPVMKCTHKFEVERISNSDVIITKLSGAINAKVPVDRLFFTDKNLFSFFCV